MSERPAPALPPAIDVRGLRRVYSAKPSPVVAIDGIDLEVAPGEFFGLLGPNGAGKTTLIKILTTLLLPTEGSARIFGFDVATDTRRIRRIMNMVAGGEQSATASSRSASSCGCSASSTASAPARAGGAWTSSSRRPASTTSASSGSAPCPRASARR